MSRSGTGRDGTVVAVGSDDQLSDADQEIDAEGNYVAPGVIDCVATDHAPHTDAQKRVDDPFGNTWEAVSGFVGLETEVPAVLTFVDEGQPSIEQWADMHSRRPAQIWGMHREKGSIRVGTDADLTVGDPGFGTRVDVDSIDNDYGEPPENRPSAGPTRRRRRPRPRRSRTRRPRAVRPGHG